MTSKKVRKYTIFPTKCYIKTLKLENQPQSNRVFIYQTKKERHLSEALFFINQLTTVRY